MSECNDSNGNGTPDLNDPFPLTAADPDLKPLALSLVPAPSTGTVELSVPPGVTLWLDALKGTFVEGTNVTDRIPDTGPVSKLVWSLSSLALPSVLFAEGTAPDIGYLILEYRNALGTLVASDRV